MTPIKKGKLLVCFIEWELTHCVYTERKAFSPIANPVQQVLSPSQRFTICSQNSVIRMSRAQMAEVNSLILTSGHIKEIINHRRQNSSDGLE